VCEERARRCAGFDIQLLYLFLNLQKCKKIFKSLASDDKSSLKDDLCHLKWPMSPPVDCIGCSELTINNWPQGQTEICLLSV